MSNTSEDGMAVNPKSAWKKIQNDSQHQELLKFLSKGNTDFSAIDEFGWTPLHKAIELDDIEIVKQLIFNKVQTLISPTTLVPLL